MKCVLSGVTEMDTHFVCSRSDPPVHNGGVFALLLNSADICLPFLRLGRNSTLVCFVLADLLANARFTSMTSPLTE